MGCFQTPHPGSGPRTKPAVLPGLLHTPTRTPPALLLLLFLHCGCRDPRGWRELGGSSPRQLSPAHCCAVLHPGCVLAAAHPEGDGALGEGASSSHCALGAQSAAKASSAPSLSSAPTRPPPRPRGTQHRPRCARLRPLVCSDEPAGKRYLQPLPPRLTPADLLKGPSRPPAAM